MNNPIAQVVILILGFVVLAILFGFFEAFVIHRCEISIKARRLHSIIADTKDIAKLFKIHRDNGHECFYRRDLVALEQKLFNVLTSVIASAQLPKDFYDPIWFLYKVSVTPFNKGLWVAEIKQGLLDLNQRLLANIPFSSLSLSLEVDWAVFFRRLPRVNSIENGPGLLAMLELHDNPPVFGLYEIYNRIRSDILQKYRHLETEEKRKKRAQREAREQELANIEQVTDPKRCWDILSDLPYRSAEWNRVLARFLHLFQTPRLAEAETEPA